MRCVPMLDCPYCGIRQYAAAAYAELPRCVVCDGFLARPKSVSPKVPLSRSPGRDGEESRERSRPALANGRPASAA